MNKVPDWAGEFPRHRPAARPRIGNLAAVTNRITRRDFLGAGARLAVAASLGAGAMARLRARSARGHCLEDRRAALAPGIHGAERRRLQCAGAAGPEGALLVDGGYAAQCRRHCCRRGDESHRQPQGRHADQHALASGADRLQRSRWASRARCIIAHEVTRLYLGRPVASVDYAGLYGPLAENGRPGYTTRTTGTLTFAGQPVEYGYLPAAHTNGDLYVHFPDANLLVAGGPVCSECLAAARLAQWRLAGRPGEGARKTGRRW